MGRAAPSPIGSGSQLPVSRNAEWCRPGVRGPRRQSNIKRGPADGVPRGGSDDRVTERSTPHRSSEDRSDRGLAGGALRTHAWPIDSREAKESRTVVTCRLTTRRCPAFPAVAMGEDLIGFIKWLCWQPALRSGNARAHDVRMSLYKRAGSSYWRTRFTVGQ